MISNHVFAGVQGWRLFSVYGRSLFGGLFCLARGGATPLLERKLGKLMGQMNIFHVGSHRFEESLLKLLRELRFSYCSSREIAIPRMESHVSRIAF